MLTREQIKELIIFTTPYGRIIACNKELKPLAVIGQLEEIDYRYLIGAAALQFNALEEMQAMLKRSINKLEDLGLDQLVPGLSEIVGMLELVQKAALEGALASLGK